METIEAASGWDTVEDPSSLVFDFSAVDRQAGISASLLEYMTSMPPRVVGAVERVGCFGESDCCVRVQAKIRILGGSGTECNYTHMSC